MYLMDLPFYSFMEEPFGKHSPPSFLDNTNITVSATLQLHAQSLPAWSRPPKHAPFPFATGLRPRIHFQQHYWIYWLLTYLYYYPPARAFKKPVAASSIILTGESSGANLCFAFLQFLLELGRQHSTLIPNIRFIGKNVSVPSPAGVASVGG